MIVRRNDDRYGGHRVRRVLSRTYGLFFVMNAIPGAINMLSNFDRPEATPFFPRFRASATPARLRAP